MKNKIKDITYNLLVGKTTHFVFKTLFPLWQKLGFHLIRNHYYEPIPDTRNLNPKLWTQRNKLAGIDLNAKKQLELLDAFHNLYGKEYEKFPRYQTGSNQFYIHNQGFESVDAEMLYCIIRHFKPKRIFEIGSGSSTLLIIDAIKRNVKEGIRANFTVIDPFPSQTVKASSKISKLHVTKVQETPSSVFKNLKKNDILFIDSSHIATIGSDVQYLFLEILPRLSKGVIIHIHDIFIPSEYPRSHVLKEYNFWNEQYILQAFLTFNNAFEILWSGNFIHLNYPSKLEAAFTSYNKKNTKPGSFWIRKIR